MNRAIAWFAENHVAANLLMTLLALGGLAVLPSIQQTVFPDIDVERVRIGVSYRGAAPEEVEQGVCIRIEEEIHGIAGIKRITSRASEGYCRVSVELLSGYPVDRALGEIESAVDAIDTFPADTERPVVGRVTPHHGAIDLALAGRASEKALLTWGERIRDGIAALPEVSQVELEDTREYEISIEVPEASLRRHGLSFDQVVEAVRRGSLDRPGGSIRTRGGEILLRTVGQAYVGEEFEALVVHTRPDGTRLLLGEIAEVVDGFEEVERHATLDGEPAVLIEVNRVGDERVLDLVASVKRYVADASALLPDGLRLVVWDDDAQVLRDRLDLLLGNGLWGFVLVFVVMALFLRLRLAFWVALGVPIAFLGALLVFPVFDVSIDIMSIFAFILVLGLLVDDAIVVGENAHRHQERAEAPLAAAIRGTQEVSVPVIFGVLTSVAAFLPLLLLPGPMGQVAGAIGIVAISALAFSLVESQLVLPAHLGHMRIRRREDEGEHAGRGGVPERWRRVQRWLAGSLERLATHGFGPFLERVLVWRYASLAVGVSILLVAVAYAFSGHMKFSFFPPIDSDRVEARLTMPLGTPAAVTARALREVEEAAHRVQTALDERYPGEPIILHVLTSLGDQSWRGGGPGSGGGANGSHVGEVQIALQGGDVRPLSADAVARLWRQEVPPIADLADLTFFSELFSSGEPIDIELQSADVGLLQRAAEDLVDRLADYPGVFDIASSFRGGKEEIVLSILPAAETLGLTLDDLGRQVRQAFYGAEAQRIQRGRHDVRVMVRYPEQQRRSLADLEELRIRTADGAEVPFHAVARARRGTGFATIARADRQRVINVSAAVDETVTTPNAVLADLRRAYIPGLLERYPGLGYGLAGEQREQTEMATAMLVNYLLALVLIYGLLAVPLRSYAQPLIIMAVIPFGLVGAVVGHVVRGLTLSMMSIFGIVAVSGVVVNASLVLVHYVNRKRQQGVPLVEAVRAAGVARFRPIVLTSATTFVGLTPLLVERSVSAQFLLPMAASLAFGVVFATAISLLLVPCAYLVLEDLRALLHRAWRARRAPGPPPEGLRASG